LAGNEGRPASRAGLLSIRVGEERPLARDTVDIRRLPAHHAAVIGANIPYADVIGHDDDDVGFPFGIFVSLRVLRSVTAIHRLPGWAIADRRIDF
jgi:hypothetical protein